jgi:signal transduction histidine kinase
MKRDKLSQTALFGKVENSVSQRLLATDTSIITILQEVRNPLTSINLAIGILGDLTSTEDKEIVLSIVGNSSRKIEILINSLLIFSEERKVVV